MTLRFPSLMPRFKGHLCWFWLGMLVLANAPLRAGAPEKVTDGIIVPIGDTFLKVEVCADDVVRVASATDRTFFARESLAVGPKRVAKVDCSLTNDGGTAT